MFSIKAPAGIVGIRDIALSLPAESASVDRFVADLRERAEMGELFFIEADDPVSYRMEIIANGNLPAEVSDEFEPCGGVFRLRAGLPQTGNGDQIAIVPGEYLVRPYSRRPFDGSRYDRAMVRQTGEADWRFHRRVTSLGAIGCLCLIAGAILLAIPFTRQFWWVVLPVLVIPSLTYLIVTRFPRHERVERLIATYERQLPPFDCSGAVRRGRGATRGLGAGHLNDAGQIDAFSQMSLPAVLAVW